MMIGNDITLSASAAAKPDRGRPRISTYRLKTNRPATTDGSAVIASTTVRTRRENGPGNSLRNTAQVIPSGTVITNAIEISISVPATPCSTPPLVNGSSGPVTERSLVYRLGCTSAGMPRTTT